MTASSAAAADDRHLWCGEVGTPRRPEPVRNHDAIMKTKRARVWDRIAAAACLGTLAFLPQPVRAQLLTNGDFETGAAAFIEWPGYVWGANPAEIPGWVGAGQRGINPVFPGDSTDAPFRDNGDNFTTVAFLQGPATLQQDISGFSIGSPYVLSLDFNASTASRDFPVFSVFLDDVPSPHLPTTSQLRGK